MIGTYASAALICAASLLVGRAILGLAGGGGSRTLAGARGRLRRRADGDRLPRPGARARDQRRRSGLVALVIAAAASALAAPPARPRRVAAARGLPVAVLVALILSIPFAVSGRWGMLGVGFNNDLGLHLAWAEWLRSGLGPAPEAGYPLGPHALADGDRRAAGNRPRPGLRRRDLRDRHPHRADRPDRARRSRAGAPGARRGAGRDPLPRRLLLRPGRLQGDRRGALRPRLRRLPPRPRPPTGRRAHAGSG